MHGFCLLLSAAALVVALISHWTRWDELAPLTQVPFLLWGAGGGALAVAAAWFGRRRASGLGLVLLTGAGWIVGTFALADEIPGLLRWNWERPEPGPPALVDGRRPLRIITLNCHGRSAEAADAVALWAPDIVFFQESPGYPRLRELAGRLYGEEARIVSGLDAAFIARGSRLEVQGRRQRHWTIAELTLPDGSAFVLANMHLNSAATDMRLWKRSVWRAHIERRRERRAHIAAVLTELDAAAATGKRSPVIVAGDFNAPPPDGSLRLLEARFVDTALAASSGWCNTYSNALPLLRIDQVWVDSAIRPVRHRVVRIAKSDHRMVVCDVVLRGPDPAATQSSTTLSGAAITSRISSTR